LHAGDIGMPDVLAALREIAPVIAVRGNNDRGRWARALPEARTVKLGALRIHLLHDVNELDFEPAARGIAAVISGHSHWPSITRRGGVLFVNPGSAGPRRFDLPVSLARCRIAGHRLHARLVHIPIRRISR
jgi:uncharacterized protein